MPYFMVSAYIGSTLLLSNPLFFIAFIGQTLGYGIALMGFIFPRVFSSHYCQTLTYLVIGHAANLLGGLNYLFNKQTSSWTRVRK